MKKLILLAIVLALNSAGIIEVETTEQTAAETTAPQIEAYEQAEVIHLTDENYYDVIENTKGVVLVDFWADWCGPCLQLGPILEEICEEENIFVYKVNVDECPNLSSDFQITGIPMVYIYKDGEMVNSQLGLADKSTYIELINKYK